MILIYRLHHSVESGHLRKNWLRRPNGAKVVLINPVGFEVPMGYAHKVIYTENNLDALKQLAKEILNIKEGNDYPGMEEFRIQPGIRRCQ